MSEATRDSRDVTRLRLSAALFAGVAAATAVYLTPPPGPDAAAAVSGWPRLVLYALGGVILGLSAPRGYPNDPVLPRRAARGAYLLLALGVAASCGVAAVGVSVLSHDSADPLGPPLWIASMLLLLGYSLLFTRVRCLGWQARWPSTRDVRVGTGGGRLLSPLALVALLVIAAALRLPALGDIPLGINADEGDRAATAFDVLNGQGSAGWFDTGWYFISMVYFRLLAATMVVFGPGLAGGRMLNALVGIGFVAVIAWIGCRNFGWRVGLLATTLAAGMGMTLQHSRIIAETGPTALLWALSIGGFLEGARSGRPWAWAVAGLTGGLGLYFYPSARLWAVGAVLTMTALWIHQRGRQLWLGCGLAAVGALVAAAPFLVHLTSNPGELTLRYSQTAVVDPNNQSRLSYLTPPEPLPALVALQTERTLGLFDRYPDGNGFLPTGRPLFPASLAALTLLGAAYVSVRAFSDARLAVLSVWFWLGLSGVALTVETPDYLRAVGMSPSLCFVLAVPLMDVVDRLLDALPGLTTGVRRIGVVALPAALAICLVTPEVASYFDTFRSMPSSWGPATREGETVAALGVGGPVYSLEMNEHLMSSGWVRLLAPHAARGRVPNPGRELPAVAPVGAAEPVGALRPDMVPGDGQGLSVVLSSDVNQDAYIDLLHRLYPLGTWQDVSDGRRLFTESAAALADERGIMLVNLAGAARPVDVFGDIPDDVALPAELTWRAGIRTTRPGSYHLVVDAPSRAQLRVDNVLVANRADASAPPLAGEVVAAPGLHYVELVAEVSDPNQRVALSVGDSPGSLRELTPSQTYRRMDAPWGLLARIGRPVNRGLVEPSDAFLDATVAMAFFGPELGLVTAPNSISWTGTLLAPYSGTYRMAFAAEDSMHLQVDGQPVDVVTVGPDDWPSVGIGSPVHLSVGPHTVRVELDITHGGRELARWNWVPPRPGGGLDAMTEWSVVPPQVLRPDPPVAVVPTASH